jgi:hypothetical protein
LEGVMMIWGFLMHADTLMKHARKRGASAQDTATRAKQTARKARRPCELRIHAPRFRVSTWIVPLTGDVGARHGTDRGGNSRHGDGCFGFRQGLAGSTAARWLPDVLALVDRGCACCQS